MNKKKKKIATLNKNFKISYFSELSIYTTHILIKMVGTKDGQKIDQFTISYIPGFKIKKYKYRNYNWCM